MPTYLIVILQIILAYFVWTISYLFWQLLKRSIFMKQAMRNQELLKLIITPDSISSPTDNVNLYLMSGEITYAQKILYLSRADRSTMRNQKLLFTFFLILAFTGSYFLGWVCILINGILFILCSFANVSKAAQNNAYEHILTIALILKQWHSKDLDECKRWVEQVSSFDSLYNALKVAESASQG